MRTEKKVAIVVAAALMVMGVGMMAVSSVAARNNFMGLIRTDEYEVKTYDITEDFDNIDIGVGVNDIIFQKSEDKNAHFTCAETEKIKYSVEVKSNTLFIKEKNNKTLVDFMSLNNTPSNVLYLPKDAFKNVTGSLGSGDITIDGSYSFDELSLKVGSGDIYVSDVSCSKAVEAHASSGSVNFTDVTSGGSFNAVTGSGRIELSNCEGKDVKLKTGSGRIVLDKCDGDSLVMSTGSGDIRGTLRTGKVFEAKAGSGDVSVPASTEGNGTCDVKTGSGDIDITIEG
ncbi:DUF4097 family beta strand repeat-containing protein [Butyrivibrio sp. MC2021]|uniref:DUF4097 family beta strand repeat-containing protein n=1 Tax=Butyrivibrio sp. MC2021 TaxID=1408306 RepID=UPI00047C5729|nr:DUF4097 family beta strand repeat-containing protein [Butyrivibrio sp. MC2021]